MLTTPAVRQRVTVGHCHRLTNKGLRGVYGRRVILVSNMTEKRLQIGDKAPDGMGLDVNGTAVSLDTLWQNGPTFLTFLRHFG